MIKLYLYIIIIVIKYKFNVFAKINYLITNGKINKFNWKLDILYTSYYIGNL